MIQETVRRLLPLIPVERTVIGKQRNPDRNVPTCPYPNPEIKEALELGLEYCKKYNADLIPATKS